VLEEVSGAVGFLGLESAAGVDPDADCAGWEAVVFGGYSEAILQGCHSGLWQVVEEMLVRGRGRGGLARQPELEGELTVSGVFRVGEIQFSFTFFRNPLANRETGLEIIDILPNFKMLSCI